MEDPDNSRIVGYVGYTEGIPKRSKRGCRSAGRPLGDAAYIRGGPLHFIKGLPWRPNAVPHAYYISMTGPDSRGNRIEFGSRKQLDR